ncbi:hypothetical protein V6N13_030741 [Hibiscus sabdariffa]
MDRGVVISSLQIAGRELKNLPVISDISIYASIDEQLCLHHLVEVVPLEVVGSKEVSSRCVLALTTVAISYVDVALLFIVLRFLLVLKIPLLESQQTL